MKDRTSQDDFALRFARIEGLLGELSASAAPEVERATREILTTILELHRRGLARLLELVSLDESALEALERDAPTSAMLSLHGLHPLAIETRVSRALDSLRPRFGDQLEDLTAEARGGVITVRVVPKANACGSTRAALKKDLEEALLSAAPDADSVSLELAEPAPALVTLRVRRTAESAHGEGRRMSADYFADVLPIADAIMYEGYVLYPYRASSIKNRVRWNFGGVYPRSYCEAQAGADRWTVGSEFLAIGGQGRLCIEVRFLELLERTSDEPFEAARPRAYRHACGTLATLAGSTAEYAFKTDRLHGSLELRIEALGDDQFKLSLSLRNESHCPSIERERALAETMIAAHLLLGLEDAKFVSQLDPPPAQREAALTCAQRGLWPVLAGKKGRFDRLLASPIILYDYPEIAPESRADSCDASEIDEILLLRVLTLSDREKAELRQGDLRARRILERAEALSGDEQLNLHGRLRRSVNERSSAIRVGERVRLRPKARADIFDLALAGRSATVRAVERDFEDRVHVSVTIDDDPGADLGSRGFPGHRFFFFLDELERFNEGAP